MTTPKKPKPEKKAATPKKPKPEKKAATPKKPKPEKKSSPKGRRVTEAHETRAESLVRSLLSFPGEVGGVLDKVEHLLKSAAVAGQRYEKDHWGQRGKQGLRTLYAADPNTDEVMVQLGELYAVVYQTRKGDDESPQLYEHKFGRPRPVLLYSVKQGGKLLVGGGGYRVTERGIEG